MVRTINHLTYGEIMEYLNWDLDVLGRAVTFSNLSGASANIGISQPQLSRIVAKLEECFGVSLLSREIKRKSTWTIEAHKLAEIYRKTFLDFRISAQALVEGSEQATIRIGVLEGLTDIALGVCKDLFSATKSHLIKLDVYDLPDLEAKYLGGHLDFIFSLRDPGRKKPKFRKILGYQTIDVHGSAKGIRVLSMAEQAEGDSFKGEGLKNELSPSPKIFASNSLAVRERWIKDFHGYGNLPSKLRATKSKTSDEVPALMIAGDHVSKFLWDVAVNCL